MTYKNQTEYLKTDIETILAKHIEAVEENIKRITRKNKEDIQKNLPASIDLRKKDMTHLMGVKEQPTDRAESANVVFVKAKAYANSASEFVVKIIQKDAHINKDDIIGNNFPKAWNKLPDMVKTLRSKLLFKKTLMNSKLENINQK